MTESLWDANWDDNEMLRKAAVATPENFRLQNPDNPLMSSVPNFEDLLPLIKNAREVLEYRGVDWRPKSEVKPVPKPVIGSEQHIDQILNKAAARMAAPRSRRK